MSAAAPELSVLIISYNTRVLTLACLESLFAETRDSSFEVIVVDNASSDGSARAIAEAFPQVRLLALDGNLGFAAGNNHAAGYARGEWLLLLNPDTIVMERAVDRLLRFGRAPVRGHFGIFGLATRFADGTLNPTSCWNRPTLWSLLCQLLGLTSLFRRSRLLNPEAVAAWMGTGVREVDIVSGCCLLLQRGLWERLRGFDPAFFMYGEEADLCLRARRLGVRSRVDSRIEIVHHGGASERNRADKLVRLLTAKVLLLRRHLPRWQRAVALGMLAGWPLTRMIALSVAALISRRAATGAACWRSVWRRRAEWGSGRFAGVTGTPPPVQAGA